jgi:hydrogenase maturation protease
VSRIRILGIGSPASDDQAGWLVADALLAAGIQRVDGIAIDKLDRPGANLIPLLQDAPWVILVDAMQSGEAAGTVRRFDQQDWPAYRGGLSSHGFGVLAALALARELGSLPQRLELYGIEIESVSPGEEPGEVIRRAAQELARLIASELLTPPVA